MTRTRMISTMARSALVLLLLAVPAAADDRIASDLAAAHPEGKWEIRKRDFYVHLARYNAAHPLARRALEDYLKQRLVQHEAAKRNLSVTNAEVDEFLEELDRRVREESKGTLTLEQMMEQREMDKADFRRRSHVALLRERLARSILRERDASWPAEKRVPDDTVTLTIDKLYNDTSKEFDLKDLPEGVLGMVGDIEITEYDYGRQLVRVLPGTEVARALQDLILAEQVAVMLGNRDDPTAEAMEAERRAFLIRERNRLAGASGQDPNKIALETIVQVLAQRGLTLEKVMENPGFKAQARARWHFMQEVGENELKEFYEKNSGKYGDRLRVRRILILARAQPVMIAGKKVRTLDQGRAVARAIHVRLKGGEDFAKVAEKTSDDPDVIRKNGGFVPLWLTSDAVGYEDTWAQADRLEEGEISEPFFSPGRGFVIVQLINRRRALGFHAQKQAIRRDAAEYEYRTWQTKALREAVRGDFR